TKKRFNVVPWNCFQSILDLSGGSAAELTPTLNRKAVVKLANNTRKMLMACSLFLVIVYRRRFQRCCLPAMREQQLKHDYKEYLLSTRGTRKSVFSRSVVLQAIAQPWLQGGSEALSIARYWQNNRWFVSADVPNQRTAGDHRSLRIGSIRQQSRLLAP